MPPTKKTALISKLKKSIKKPPTSLPSSPISIEPSLDDTSERRRECIRKLRGAQTLDELRHFLRLHLSLFPDDRLLSVLFQAPSMDTVASVFASVDDQSDTLLDDVVAHAKTVILATQHPSTAFFARLNGLPPSPSIDDVVHTDTFVFEPLSFLPEALASLILPALLPRLKDLPSDTPRPEIRHIVNAYIFQHRYTFVISYLEGDHDDKEKQSFVERYVRLQYQNSRSFKVFLLIDQLVEDKKQGFGPVVAQILIRYLPDAQNITSLRRYIEVILDVVINRTEPRLLKKYFANTSQYTHFLNVVYPKIPSTWDRMIQERLWTEFPQSFVFQHAGDIPWRTFLEIVRQPALSSLELRLYNLLQHNAHQRLEDVIRYVQQKDVERMHLRALLQRYISTQPFKHHTHLNKLLSLSTDRIRELLTSEENKNYITILQSLTVAQDIIPPSENTGPSPLVLTPTREQADLYRLRLYVPDFLEVLIAPIDSVGMYTASKRENGLYVPNDRFFDDLADTSLSRSQRGTVFRLNGASMTVVNVTLHGQHIEQDEEMYVKEVNFIRSQTMLDTLTHPLAYFEYFMTSPLLNHQSSFMTAFRLKTTRRLERVLLRNVENVRALGLSQDIEREMYMNAKDLKTYTENIARLITLISGPYAITLKRILLRLRIEKLPSIIDDPAFLVPELNHAEGPLADMVQRDTYDLFRSMMLDAYFIEFPTRRIPYLPHWRHHRIDADTITVTFDDAQRDMYITTVLRDLLFDDDVYVAVTQNTTDTDTPSSSSPPVPQEEDTDPLASFLDVAFREVARLGMP